MNPHHKWSTPASHWPTYINFLIMSAVALTVFIRISTGLDTVLYWESDYAIFLMDMFNASQMKQLVGISSRFGWAHPGPINYYTLLPWYWVSNEREGSLMLGTLVYNVSFICASTWATYKISNKEIASLFLSSLILYATTAMGFRVLFDVLLPYSTIFAWIFSISAAVAIASKNFRLIPAFLFALSYLTQMHVAFWIPAFTLGLSTIILSIINEKPSAKEIFLWVVGGTVFLITWLPPLLEMTNLANILNFFSSRPASEHSLLEAVRALAVLMGEPVAGQRLLYGEERPGGVPLIIGTLCILVSIACAAAAWKYRIKNLKTLSILIAVQITTYTYALSKITGSILHHSITFMPMIIIFIGLQTMLLIQHRATNLNVRVLLSATAALATLVFFTTHFHNARRSIESSTTPNKDVELLYNALSNATSGCSETPTVNMNQAIWEPIVGAVSVLYRNNTPFNITPPMWSIIANWKIPTSNTKCIINFVQKDEKILIRVSDYNSLRQKPKTSIASINDANFDTYGVATFERDTLTVRSDSFTDAGFVSKQFKLPAGSYKLDAIMTWSTESQQREKNSAHLSIHGDHMLYAVEKSNAENERIESYFTSNGEPFRLSFGLGGWSNGKGFIRLNALHISMLDE